MMEVSHFVEPELEFGGHGRHVDIRFGISQFGPFDKGSSQAPISIKLGFVGSAETASAFRVWLDSCRRPIPGKDTHLRNLFPGFPGFQDGSSFGAGVVLDDRQVRIVNKTDLSNLLKTTKESNFVFSVVMAIVEEFRYIIESSRVDVFICALPSELLEALDNHPSVGTDGCFHDLLKARAMELGVPIQMVRPGTYGLKVPGAKAGKPVQDPATVAWNFFTALYYKAGGIPWRIPKVADSFTTCFVGVSFYRVGTNQMSTSMAQVFDTRGTGIIVRGDRAKRDKDKQAHLTEEGASKLLSEALQLYRKEHRNLPARVVIHKTTSHNDAEKAGFRRAIEESGVSGLDLVSVYKSGTRLFRTQYYPPLRGTMVSLDTTNHVIYLRGSVEFFQTFPGMYVPRPILFRLDDVEESAKTIGSELLALSKQNWNNTQFDGGAPITVRAARQVGAILKHVHSSQLVRPGYSYFM